MTVTDEPSEQSAKRGPHPLKRLHAWLHRHPVTGLATKVVITIVGGLVVLAGVVLSGPGVPGPGLLVIVFGLAILATEWAWAERLLTRARRWLEAQRDKARQMDPAVRRRRIVQGLVILIVLTGGAAAYLWYFGWPDIAITGWDWVQSLSGAVPELPGM